MAWTHPLWSKSRVDRAGLAIAVGGVSAAELSESIVIVNNWRSSHAFPLNTIQMGLRQRAFAIDRNALIAQRLKRAESVRQKLFRFPTMKLSQVQDIGGCRAVVESTDQVRALVESSLKSRMKHKLLRTSDYLAQPQASGYRGVHLVYRYYSDRSDVYNGLLIEVQLRSLLQHYWATAVETVGTFIKQSLKSSQGEADWLRFFALMGSVIALREGTSLVPGTPIERAKLIAELHRYAILLNVEQRLLTYGSALRTLGMPELGGVDYYLLVLEPSENQVRIRGFRRGQLEQATSDYMEIERQLDPSSGAEAVLASVNTIDNLRRAYPNYFLDTREFAKLLRFELSN